jgi:hypothetical protein
VYRLRQQLGIEGCAWAAAWPRFHLAYQRLTIRE